VLSEHLTQRSVHFAAEINLAGPKLVYAWHTQVQKCVCQSIHGGAMIANRSRAAQKRWERNFSLRDYENFDLQKAQILQKGGACF